MIYNKRIYLVPTTNERDIFRANPQKYESVDIASDGYCSVCAVMAKKWVKGKAEFTSIYDGMRYFFPSADEKRIFDSNPTRFVPTLDGDCVVCLRDSGKRVKGDIKYGVLHQGRLYLHADEAAQRAFLAEPQKYANVDVANQGNCVVCAKMARKEVAGKMEHISIYKGIRYFFPSDKERMMFDADPASLAVKDNKIGMEDTPENIHIIGRTTCAACVYGVHPLTDSNRLGIAVVSGDKVYIIEEGEKRYPNIFQSRSEGLNTQLKGTIKKREGKFI